MTSWFSRCVCVRACVRACVRDVARLYGASGKHRLMRADGAVRLLQLDVEHQRRLKRAHASRRLCRRSRAGADARAPHLRALMMHHHQVVHDVQSKFARCVQFQHVGLLARALPAHTRVHTHVTLPRDAPCVFWRAPAHVPWQVVEHHLGTGTVGAPGVMLQVHHVQLAVTKTHTQDC